MLAPADQSLIAIWSVKTAMVLEAVGSAADHVYTQAEREALRTSRSLLWRSSVWLAAEAGGSHFFSTQHRHISQDEPPSASTTMAFAQLAVQVLIIRVPANAGPQTRITTDVRLGEWHDATIQLRPNGQTPVAWPPRLGLNGELGLTALSERFNAAGLAPDRLQSLVV